jgi:hypothetical protein
MTRPNRPVQLVAASARTTAQAPDAALGPWVSAADIQADPDLPYRHASVKWILAHVAPDDRKKLGRKVLWRRSAIVRWTETWAASREGAA